MNVKTSCIWRWPWNRFTCSYNNGKYLASIIDHSVIACNETIESNNEETKTVLANINEKKVTCKTQNFYALPIFF